MNWADYAIVIILAVSSLISIKRGFIKEALSLLIWVAAFLIANHFSAPLASLLEAQITTPSLRQVSAFGLLFVATLLVGAAVNYLISTLVKVTGLSGTDRLLGMLFGFARGTLIILAAVVYVPKFLPIDKDIWWQQSMLIPHFVSMESTFELFTSSISKEVTNLL